MNRKLRQVVRKVLNAAANTPSFFDFSDAERLNHMIADAFIRGKLSGARAKRQVKQRHHAKDREQR
jgi:hypothetical protein